MSENYVLVVLVPRNRIVVNLQRLKSGTDIPSNLKEYLPEWKFDPTRPDGRCSEKYFDDFSSQLKLDTTPFLDQTDGTISIFLGVENNSLAHEEQKYCILEYVSKMQNWFGHQDDVVLLINLPTTYRKAVRSSLGSRHLLFAILEILEPRFAFSCSTGLFGLHRGTKPLIEEPWKHYWDTMVFGAEMVNLFGRDKLLLTPAHRVYEINSRLIYTSSLKGLGNEDILLDFVHDPELVKHKFRYDFSHSSSTEDLLIKIYEEQANQTQKHLGLTPAE